MYCNFACNTLSFSVWQMMKELCQVFRLRRIVLTSKWLHYTNDDREVESTMAKNSERPRVPGRCWSSLRRSTSFTLSFTIGSPRVRIAFLIYARGIVTRGVISPSWTLLRSPKLWLWRRDVTRLKQRIKTAPITPHHQGVSLLNMPTATQ